MIIRILELIVLILLLRFRNISQRFELDKVEENISPYDEQFNTENDIC